MDIKGLIRTIPHWPQQGVMFRDITTLLKDPRGFAQTIDQLHQTYRDREIEVVAGIEARGFIFAAALACRLGRGFVPIRKKGKLPGATFTKEYQLEYGSNTVEIHQDGIEAGQKVLLVDDVLATGGSCLGAIDLLKRCDGKLVEACFVITLPELGGADKLTGAGIPWKTLLTFSSTD